MEEGVGGGLRRNRQEMERGEGRRSHPRGGRFMAGLPVPGLSLGTRGSTHLLRVASSAARPGRQQPQESCEAGRGAGAQISTR